MFTVATVSTSLVTSQSRVVEQAKQAEVSASGKQLSVLRASHTVDLSFVFIRWVNALNVPALLGVFGGPSDTACGLPTVNILCALRHIPE